MKPTIRQTPEGIELYDGDNLNFRAWPLTTEEAADLARRLVDYLDERGWFKPQPKRKKARR